MMPSTGLPRDLRRVKSAGLLMGPGLAGGMATFYVPSQAYRTHVPTHGWPFTESGDDAVPTPTPEGHAQAVGTYLVHDVRRALESENAEGPETQCFRAFQLVAGAVLSLRT